MASAGPSPVRAPAALRRVEMWMTVFLAQLAGARRRRRSRACGASCARSSASTTWRRAIRDCVIPRLRRAGRL